MPPPRDALADLVRSLKDLMESSLERPALFMPYGAVLRGAWPSVSARLDVILTALEASANDISDDDLERHGLSGPELEAKWRVFTGERDRFERELARRRLFGHPAPVVSLATEYVVSEEKVGFVGSLRRFARRTIQSPLWKALAVADEVMGSLGDAFPPVAIAASALGEFKGTMEAVATPE